MWECEYGSVRQGLQEDGCYGGAGFTFRRSWPIHFGHLCGWIVVQVNVYLEREREREREGEERERERDGGSGIKGRRDDEKEG